MARDTKTVATLAAAVVPGLVADARRDLAEGEVLCLPAIASDAVRLARMLLEEASR